MKLKAVSRIVLSLLFVAMLALAFNIQQVKAQKVGLIAYHQFNGNANDESGNNHDGTVHGATLATDRFGNPNSAYSFDGVNDYVEVPHDADFDFGTGGFTVSAWIKTNATTTAGSGRDDIVAKGDPTISGYAISIRYNKAVFWTGSGGGLFGSSVLNDGEWHQIVGTRDDSGNVVLYVDGVSESMGINNQNVNTTYSIFIGKHGTVSESYFDGLIDEVCIYNRALTAEEIEELYYTIYEHELAVFLEVPAHLEPSGSSLLNATVYNYGLGNETDVELFLLINETEVNHVMIPELVNGTFYTIDYLWTPTVEGIYNVTAYASPVLGENLTANNWNSKFARVRYGYDMWKKYLKTDVYEDYDTYIPTPQDFGEYVGLVADNSTLIPATYGDEWSIFGFRTLVRVSNPKEITIGIVGDDGVGLYLDGNFVCGRGNAEDPMSYGTMMLSAGWHKIEALVYTGPTMYELEFDKKISDYVEAMNSGRPHTISGDIDGDGVVGIDDIVICALAFGSQPGDPNWNPIVDCKQDYIIDIFDLVMIGVNFGKTS